MKTGLNPLPSGAGKIKEREGKKMKARTPKGREVKVYDINPIGTACHEGRLAYGDVPVAYWCTSGSGLKSLEEALAYADEKIDKCGLLED